MPSISKIRFTNIIYDNRQKRFNDDTFIFDGNNAAVLLENGGGKTVFIQCALQAVIPHSDLGDRKIKETLLLDNTCAHIAIEWILKDRPRQYCVTAVSLYKDSNGSVTSYRFINEYGADSVNSIDNIPFSHKNPDGSKRPASREEINEYYSKIKASSILARTFNTIQDYQATLSKEYGIIASEWRSQIEINSKEGGVDKFFNACSTTGHLVDNLLIPSIERVIAGEGEKGFAKTFETQRDSFKEYNRLTRLIAESDRAAERLNAYVNEYARLNKKQQEMLKIKKLAKSLRRLADADLNRLDTSYDELIKQKAVAEKEKAVFLYKRESLNVLITKSELDIAESKLAEADEIYNKCKGLYDEKASRKENIELSSAENKIKVWEAKLRSVRAEIEMLDENPDIAELRDMYDNYAALLKGCYIGIEESITKELININIQIKKYTNEINVLKTELENINNRLSEQRYKKSGLESEISIFAKEINELKRKILIDLTNDRVMDFLSQYNKRLAEIENRLSALNAEINGIDIRISDIKTIQPEIQSGYDKANADYIRISERIASTKAKIEKLSNGLNADYKEFYNLRPANFYDKEKAIKDTFEAILFKAVKNKEDMLLGERIKKRLSDAYENSEYFTGVPELYDIVEGLKNRYGFIQAGVQYIVQASQALGIHCEELLTKFPFWHYAVIVNSVDAERLKQELFSKELACPVLVLTRDKAHELIESDGLDLNSVLDSVLPDFWVSNFDNKYFTIWKHRIKEQGEAAERLRYEAENELGKIQEDINNVKNFFFDYPNGDYMQMNKEKTELEIKINEYRKQSQALINELEQITNSRKTAVEIKSELETEAVYINKNREHVQKIIKMEEENKNRSREIMRITEQIDDDQNKAATVSRKIEDMEENKENQKDSRQEAQTKLAILHNKEWYKALKDITPDMRGDLPEEALIDRLDGLKRKLMDVSDSRQRLDERQSNFEESRQIEETHFIKLKKEAKYPIDQSFQYYEGIEHELIYLESQLPLLYQDMNNQNNKKVKLSNFREGKEAVYKDNLKKFKSKYEDLYVFAQGISETVDILKEEESVINSRFATLEKDLANVKDEQSKATEAVRKLLEIDREFKFGNIDDEGKEYPDTLNYPYNRLKCVEEMDTKLQQAFENMRNEEQNIIKARRIYCEHCRREISDIRNRDRLIELVESAADYATLKDGQKTMNNSLEAAKMTAHISLGEREEKMRQFTNQLYTHVEKIAKELLLIPKKTKIRIGDAWREIFDISYREWNEKEARMAIRSQINYILDRIENNTEYKTDDGTDDLTKIRAFIEKSLKTKQLLKKIIGSNEIRVQCRKVTNDNHVLSRLHSWEESEKWSGGERWSKNMALFLGIQNYISEKTEPDLISGKSKSCVLLDNPFGIASSEHVLNPVFFVAKELGFQVIAVTAHAEGKFISDYFPVVYSLKLREAVGGKTSVMTREHTINQAFFNDKSPLEFERMFPKEQMSLF